MMHVRTAVGVALDKYQRDRRLQAEHVKERQLQLDHETKVLGLLDERLAELAKFLADTDPNRVTP